MTNHFYTVFHKLYLQTLPLSLTSSFVRDSLNIHTSEIIWSLQRMTLWKSWSWTVKYLFFYVAHLGSGVIGYCKSPWWLLNIRQFYNNKQGHSAFTKNGIQIKFAHLDQLVVLLQKIENRYPRLKESVPCYADHDNQEAYFACARCNRDHPCLDE